MDPMYLLTAAILTLIFSIPFIRRAHFYKDGQSIDLFSPERLSALHLFALTVPFLIAASVREEFVVSELLYRHVDSERVSVTALRFGCLQALGFVCLLAGVYCGIGRRVASRIAPIATSDSSMRCMLLAATMLALGSAAYSLFLSRVGGLLHLVSHLDFRTSFYAGNGYIMQLFILSFSLMTLSYVYSRRTIKHPFWWLGAALVCTLSLVAFTTTGSRSWAVHLMAYTLLVWHYGVKRFRLSVVNLTLGLAVLVIYVVFIPLVRGTGGTAVFYNVGDVVEGILGNVSRAAAGNEYVNIQMLIISHFHPGNLWWGASYIDLIQGPIPSSFLPDKPPIDEGMYIWSIAKGMDVHPPMPQTQLLPSAWPPGTFGTLYVNFWMPGVAIGYFLLGVVLETSYCYMRKSAYSLLSIILYGYLTLRLQLSNLGLMFTVVSTVFMGTMCLLFFGMGRKEGLRIKKPFGSDLWASGPMGDQRLA